MFYLIAAIFTLVFWVIALVFLILTIVFRKKKVGRWIFATLTVLFALFPFAVYWGLAKSEEAREMEFAGRYVNVESDNFLVLNTDKTWTADSTLFDCESGQWAFVSSEDLDYLELTGKCDNGTMFMQIGSCSPVLITVTPDQKGRNITLSVELHKE